MTLDNPFWSALDSIHRDVALRAGGVARYPAAYAPFLGVGSAEVPVGHALDALVASGESVYLSGLRPRRPRAGRCRPSVRWRRWCAMNRWRSMPVPTSSRSARRNAMRCWR